MVFADAHLSLQNLSTTAEVAINLFTIVCSISSLAKMALRIQTSVSIFELLA